MIKKAKVNRSFSFAIPKELAEKAKEAAKSNSLNKIPVPLSKEVAMEKYEEAKKWMTIKTLGLAAIIAVAVLSILLIVPVIMLFLR